MRVKRVQWALGGLIASAVVIGYCWSLVDPWAWIAWLASQPSVTTAFGDPGARRDAWIVVIAYAFLIPIGVVALICLLRLAVGWAQPALASLRVPAWISGMLVLGVTAYGAYATSDAWRSSLLHILGLMARAYFDLASSSSLLTLN